MGDHNDVITVWKNGNVLYNLGYGKGMSISVAGNDVYVSGMEGRTVRVWKNSNPIHSLTRTNNTGFDGRLYSIFVK